MANKRTATLADFSAWNIAFMLLYFLNAVNITLEFGKPMLGSVAVALMGVQSGIVTFLAFTRKPSSALISAILPVGGYYAYVYWTGIAVMPGHWIPGITIGLPAFHVIFAFLGSALVGWMQKWYRTLKLPAIIPGLGAIPGTGSKEDARLMIAVGAKLAGIAVVACVLYCIVFLLSWPGDTAMQTNVLVSLPVMAGTLSVSIAAFLVAPRAPRAIYNSALTHHIIEDADHAIGVKMGKLTIFLCTRCTAMLSGLFFTMYAFAALKLDIDPFLAFFLDIFIPAPVFVDWGLQRFGYRKATTRSRTITGALTGLGFALVTLASPDYAFHAAIVLISYFAVFFLIYILSARHGYYQKEDEGVIDV